MRFKIYILIILYIFSFFYINKAQPVKINGQLRIVGNELLNENNKIVVLKGVSLGWHNWWPRFYNKEIVSWLRDEWNCDVIRLAMGVEPNNGYLKNPNWSTSLIKEVIEAAIINDVYVIVDWHSHNIYKNEAKTFFSEIAKEYGKYPHIIYEIFNEPERISWDEVKNYSIEVIKEIRKYDEDNIILVGNPHWDQDIHIVADDPIIGFENIMYTVHFYAGSHKEFLRDRIEYALNKNIPIFISECGSMNYNGNGPIDYTEWDKWIKFISNHKLSWIAWSISDKDETCSMLNKTANSIGNWKDDDIKEWGKLVLKTLKSFK